MLGTAQGTPRAARGSGDGGVAFGSGTWLSRRSIVAAAFALLLGAALYTAFGSRGRAPIGRTHGAAPQGLSSLPLAAQGPVSAAIAADSAAYRVRAGRGGLTAVSPAQRLSSSFSSSGVSVIAGATRVSLSLRGVGYGSSLAALGSVAPTAHANRVLYEHAGLSEWYANGPLGLEQGFTLARAPAGDPTQPLTLSMAISGNARPALAVGGQSITLTHTGATVLRYSGLSVSDARGHLLRSWLALDGTRLLLRADARGARFPLRIDPFIHKGTALQGTGLAGNSQFGATVAMSSDGNTVLVGGPGDEEGPGAVWVFTRSGETWAQQGAKLTASGEIGPANLGTSIALSADGHTALIGGSGDDSSRGAAWVFTRVGETWSQQVKLEGTERHGPARLGNSVALSANGDTALVTGRADTNNLGAAWVFTRSGETWTQQGEKLTGGPEESASKTASDFGTASALSADGNTALIGASGDDGSSGSIWVFTRSGETWTQQGPKLGAAGGNLFGASVAISADGNVALVGSPHSASYYGAAWVYTRSGETWTQREELTGAGEVSTIIGGGFNAGVFGSSVAVSGDGNTFLIGGPGDYKRIGAAWVFVHSGEKWVQQGGKLSGGGAGVALSGDGTTALNGAPQVAVAWVYVPKPPTNPPEFGRCPKTNRGQEGDFGSSNCSYEKIAGSYEWLPGTVKSGFTTKMIEGVTTFETVKLSKVVCKGEASVGEHTGLSSAGGVMFTFTGCERLGEMCSSAGAEPGEVRTSALEGAIGIEKLGETAAKNKVALDLKPVGGSGPFMEFNCGATEVSLRGSVLVPVLANKMAVASTVKYLATKGKQKPERFLGGPTDVLEASFNKGVFEQIGMTAKVVQTNEEAVEVNTSSNASQAGQGGLPGPPRSSLARAEGLREPEQVCVGVRDLPELAHGPVSLGGVHQFLALPRGSHADARHHDAAIDALVDLG
jgi:hypothetical protein